MEPRQQFGPPRMGQATRLSIWHCAGTAAVAAHSRLAWTLLKQAGSARWKSSLLNLKMLGGSIQGDFFPLDGR
jgi:hypothetical protein